MRKRNVNRRCNHRQESMLKTQNGVTTVLHAPCFGGFCPRLREEWTRAIEDRPVTRGGAIPQSRCVRLDSTWAKVYILRGRARRKFTRQYCILSSQHSHLVTSTQVIYITLLAGGKSAPSHGSSSTRYALDRNSLRTQAHYLARNKTVSERVHHPPTASVIGQPLRHDHGVTDSPSFAGLRLVEPSFPQLN